MSIDHSGLRTSAHLAIRAEDVPLSPWVNERFPSWNEILTSHDVARLTRRHRWILAALSLVGHFPRKLRFRGQSIGWLRSDVDGWLGRYRHVRGPCSKVHARRPRFRRPLSD